MYSIYPLVTSRFQINVGLCRLESVSTVLANSNLDDPLENAEQLADQMESLPFIFRFEYEDMNTYFCSLMDPIVTAYSRGLAPGMWRRTHQSLVISPVQQPEKEGGIQS